MYKLYWSKETGALAPQAALEEAGAEYEIILTDTQSGGHQSAEFLALNPRGQVPTLILPDGSVMTESAAMMLHIADAFPQAKLVPPLGDAKRAQVYRWMFFAAVNFYETDLRYYYSERYTTNENGAEGVKVAALHDFDSYWDMLEPVIGKGPCLLGNTYSIVDIYLTMLAYWHPDVDALFARCPSVTNLCDAVKARPAFDRVWRQHYA
ncbi:MAG: glutathione S-transferase family protein [Gammaproteobacteria bacterium]|nr:glutathione S-transferase family protein [Gammaproteobacteria bacterium]